MTLRANNDALVMPGRRTLSMRLKHRLCWLVLVASLGLPGCASIEHGRYGVSRLALTGMHDMQESQLRDCLITQRRSRVVLRLGAVVPRCQKPPFESSPPEVAL